MCKLTIAIALNVLGAQATHGLQAMWSFARSRLANYVVQNRKTGVGMEGDLLVYDIGQVLAGSYSR